jgi:hypothetical protein
MGRVTAFLRRGWPVLGVLAVAGLLSAVLAGAPAAPLRPGPAPVAPGVELVVTGVNETGRPLPIWVRADGPDSTGYASRVNLFRSVAPGPFALHLNRADLTTAHGAVLDLGTDPTVRVFAHEGAPGLSVVAARWAAPAMPPEGVIALDFGAWDGPVFPGFTPADETYPAVAGRRIVPVTRPGVDALARDGLAGVEAVTLAVPPGRYLVKLWLEDLGAWEYLPHQLRRRVRVNGRTVVDRTDTPLVWVRDRWQGGVNAGPDAWSAFGHRRAGLVPVPVDVGAEGLRVELAGDAPGAVFVAALAVVPVAHADWLTTVETMQADRFAAAWPVDAGATVEEMTAFPAQPADLMLAPGTVGWVRIDAGTQGAVAMAPPASPDGTLPAALRLAERRLDRATPLAPHLSPLARQFRVPEATSANDPHGRPALVEVRVPAEAAPGLYRGTLIVGGTPRPFAVRVVPVALPPLPVPVGVYLADAPHHRWFRTDPRPERACRLRTLAGMGLTGVSPPLALPDAAGLPAFADDLALLRAAMPASAHLAYQEAQRLFDALGPEGAVKALAAAHAIAPDLLWSLADEPSNPGPHGRSLADNAAAIRAAAPGIRLAAHLNAPADRALADRFDIALVNPGFGIDAADLTDLGRRGVAPWIYNTGPERLAAGFYAWRAGAAGYLQWHGLLPTAHPFDPTDGREGDAMLLPPLGDPCAPTPAVDARLVSIAEGAMDRRWLAWLDQRAGTDTRAAALRAELTDAIPDRWDSARARLSPADLDRFRAAIAALALQGEG